MKIYTVDNLYSSEPLDEDEGYEKYGQKKYVRFTIAVGGVSLVLGIITIIIICQPNRNLRDKLLILNAFTLILGFAQQCQVSYYSVKSFLWIHDYFNITYELFTILALYFLFLFSYHCFTVFFVSTIEISYYMTNLQNMVSLLALRNIAWVISMVIFLKRNPTKVYITGFHETRDCIKTLEMTLSFRLGYLNLANYIEENYDEGSVIIELFSLLMTRKEKRKKDLNVAELEGQIKRLCENNAHIMCIIDIDRKSVV